MKLSAGNKEDAGEKKVWRHTDRAVIQAGGERASDDGFCRGKSNGTDIRLVGITCRVVNHFELPWLNNRDARYSVRHRLAEARVNAGRSVLGDGTPVRGLAKAFSYFVW